MVWAVACTAFFGFFRLGELLPSSAASWMVTTDLAWGDVAVDSLTEPRIVQVHLKKTKTDQSGEGADVVMAAMGAAVCPVSAIVSYLHVRGSSSGPFFKESSGKALAKPAFISELRDLLQTAGYSPGQYAGHSFRIGAATTAAMAGMEDSQIQTLGRWHNAAFLRYIRTPKTHLAGASKVLVSSICVR